MVQICTLNYQSSFVPVQWIKGYTSFSEEAPLYACYGASMTNVFFRIKCTPPVPLFLSVYHLIFTLWPVCLCGYLQ